MEASSWLLEARTNEKENQEAQRRVRGERSKLRGGKPQEALQGPTLQPTSVPPSVFEAAA